MKQPVRSVVQLVIFCMILLSSFVGNVYAQFLEEARVDDAWSEFGVSGEGVIIAVFDRGITYDHDDFRNDDGSTRIMYILDLSDDSGANDPDNPLSFGTVYTEDEINAALTSGPPLATRDAIGHGTLTAGIAGGNGRASAGEYVGVAPNASFIIVKFTSEGAPAHDGQASEAPFYFQDRLGASLDFVIDKAADAGMPFVATANFGSIQGPSDGSSGDAREIENRFGSTLPGRVFVSGSSDDGGIENHASGTIQQGQTIDIDFHKGHAGNLRIDLWYDEGDRFDVEIVTPSATFGPWAAPTGPASSDVQSGTGFVMYHQGRDVDFFGSNSNNREILVDFSGAVGDYTIRLTGATVSSGTFHALMNPSNIFSRPDNRFESFAVAGSTIWDLASAQNIVVPNSYIHNSSWVDIDGVTRTDIGNDAGQGALWPGSGVGPTLDGRTGITVSAPGNTNVGPVGPDSYFATFPHALIEGGGGQYGLLGYVSGANPVVTGVIALMLELDPTLTSNEVAEILSSTARSDAFTGAVPNTDWGGGKLDGYAAVAEVMSNTSIDEIQTGSPISWNLQAYPNPVRDRLSVQFNLDRSEGVTITVVDVVGRIVDVVSERTFSSGSNSIDVDVAALASGLYYVRASTATSVAARPIVKLD
ncbi:MAG: S8 family serine peptidase [Rhodothermales bacterium]|nr:S8 family serine peptidase [Rhodothermales bacterium]